MASGGTNPGNVNYNYSLARAKEIYALLEKPDDMSDHEWIIVSDEGFRKYLASQFGVPYQSREEMKRAAGLS